MVFGLQRLVPAYEDSYKTWYPRLRKPRYPYSSTRACTCRYCRRPTDAACLQVRPSDSGKEADPFSTTQLESTQLGLPSSMDPAESHAISEPFSSAMVHLYNVN